MRKFLVDRQVQFRQEIEEITELAACINEDGKMLITMNHEDEHIKNAPEIEGVPMISSGAVVLSIEPNLAAKILQMICEERKRSIERIDVVLRTQAIGLASFVIALCPTLVP